MADPAVVPVAGVPWMPAEAVYLHQREPVADASDNDQDPETSADFDDAPHRAPSSPRRSIPLLWAAALTVAALQHAGEVERRAAFLEPSSAEIEMRDRSEGEIRGAWRNVGAVIVVAEAKPAETAVAERKAGPLVAKQQIESVAARDVASEGLESERSLVEPITEAVPRTPTSEESEGPVKMVAENIDTAASPTRTFEAQAKADVARPLQPIAEEAEPVKPVRKGRVTTSHAPQQKTAGVAKPKRAHPARAKSIKYVELDGHSPRYFTIERPSRGSP